MPDNENEGNNQHHYRQSRKTLKESLNRAVVQFSPIEHLSLASFLNKDELSPVFEHARSGARCSAPASGRAMTRSPGAKRFSMSIWCAFSIAGVPLAELFGYAGAIRSLTRGRASYTMEPDEFAVVPKAVREQLLNR